MKKNLTFYLPRLNLISIYRWLTMSYYLSKIYRHNLSILIGKRKKLVRDGKDLCVFVKFNIWAYSSRKIVYCIKSLVLVHDMLQIESIGPCQTPLKKTNVVNLYTYNIYIYIYIYNVTFLAHTFLQMFIYFSTWNVYRVLYGSLNGFTFWFLRIGNVPQVNKVIIELLLARGGGRGLVFEDTFLFGTFASSVDDRDGDNPSIGFWVDWESSSDSSLFVDSERFL